MDHRERYIAALTFAKPDRIPMMPGDGRESTYKRWRGEGLPEGENAAAFIMRELGIPVPQSVDSGFFLDTKMNPVFEERIISHENGHYIVRDWMGAVTEISDEFDYTYIRSAKDFVTRKWHKFPVETYADWQDMKKRYDPEDPSRLPSCLDEISGKVRNRDYIISVNVNGPFWQLREWMGMENLCVAFLDEPDFVAEMIGFWSDFVFKLMERFLPFVQIDSFNISEDMAYKAHSMISPALTVKYLQPVYERWIALLRRYGVPLVDMDSDGYIEELIPIWIDSGINVCSPIEAAAHNDIACFRKRFGKNMAYKGGIDKRAIAAGGEAMRKEVMRVFNPLIEHGGFIPGCDHGVPHDISFGNYREYVELLVRLTGWL